MDHHSQALILNVANILYLASYTVRDILWLRILSVIAMLLLGGCYFECAKTEPVWWNAFYWQLAFLLINLIQIAILIQERRPVRLTAIQQRLHEGPLRTMTPRQVQRFTDKADWATIESGKRLLSQNSKLENLILILSGNANVVADGKTIAQISDGQFAGEMSFLTGDNTSADVIADGSVLVAKWPEKYVTDLIQRDQELGTALQAALGTDLVRKILRSRS